MFDKLASKGQKIGRLNKTIRTSYMGAISFTCSFCKRVDRSTTSKVSPILEPITEQPTTLKIQGNFEASPNTDQPNVVEDAPVSTTRDTHYLIDSEPPTSPQTKRPTVELLSGSPHTDPQFPPADLRATENNETNQLQEIELPAIVLESAGKMPEMDMSFTPHTPAELSLAPEPKSNINGQLLVVNQKEQPANNGKTLLLNMYFILKKFNQ